MFEGFRQVLQALSRVISAIDPRDAGIARIFGGGRATASGQRVDEARALTLSAFYAGIQVLSETKGQVPFCVIKNDGARRTRAYGHAAWWVFHDEMNPEMSAAVGWELLETYRKLWGNAYAEIQWDGGGNIRAMWPLEPWRVEPQRDGARGSLYYLVDGQRQIAREDMFHVPGFSFDGLKGKSVIAHAAESLGLSLAAQEYGATYFGNGAAPGILISHPKRLSPQARENLSKDFQTDHSRAGRGHGVYVAEEGVRVDRIGSPPEEAQFLATRAGGVVEVSRWLNMPPHLLRDLAHANYNALEQQALEFVIFTMQPTFVKYEQEAKRKVFGRGGEYYAKHNVNALVRGDMLTRYKAYAIARNWGWKSADDVLELEDENPLPTGQGKIYLVPRNMISADQFKDPPHTGGQQSEKAPTQDPAQPQGPAGKQNPAGEKQSAIERQLRRQFAEVVITRLTYKEANAVGRAARNPQTFLSRVDTFYERHTPQFVAALEPAEPTAADLVAKWRDLAREGLLAAAECQPAELVARVQAVTDHWQADRITSFNPEQAPCLAPCP